MPRTTDTHVKLNDGDCSQFPIRTVLLAYEFVTLAVLCLSILCGALAIPEDHVIIQLVTVVGLFIARIALTFAQEGFSGNLRTVTIAAQLVPTMLLPRVGTIDPIAVPVILTALQLKQGGSRMSTALAFGVVAVVLRELIFIDALDAQNLSLFLFSSFAITVPMLVSIRLLDTLEANSLLAADASRQHKAAQTSLTLRELRKQINDILTLNAAGNLADRNSSLQSLRLQIQELLIEHAHRATVETASAEYTNSSLTTEQTASVSAPNPVPQPKPAGVDFPAKLHNLDLRVLMWFAAFYGYYVFVVAGDPRHNGVLQISSLALITLVTVLAIKQVPPGKELAYMLIRVVLIAFFSFGCLNYVNGDILLYLTAPQLFLVLGKRRGLGPFLLALAAAFFPRGNDLVNETTNWQFDPLATHLMYDWNGHATTASIVALLGAGGYAIQSMREGPATAASAPEFSTDNDEEDKASYHSIVSCVSEVAKLLDETDEQAPAEVAKILHTAVKVLQATAGQAPDTPPRHV